MCSIKWQVTCIHYKAVIFSRPLPNRSDKHVTSFRWLTLQITWPPSRHCWHGCECILNDGKNVDMRLLPGIRFHWGLMLLLPALSWSPSLPSKVSSFSLFSSICLSPVLWALWMSGCVHIQNSRTLKVWETSPRNTEGRPNGLWTKYTQSRESYDCGSRHRSLQSCAEREILRSQVRWHLFLLTEEKRVTVCL